MILKIKKFIKLLLIVLTLCISGCVTININPTPTYTYTITYHLDGGINHPNNPVTYTNKSTTITLIVATKDSYSFDGWYREASFINSIIIIPTGTTGNLELYAKWTPLQTTTQSTITFDSNGGSSISPITQNVGSSLIAPSNPTKTNYTFAGWYTDNTTFLNAYTFNTMPSSNLTLYAKWTSNTTAGLICNAFGSEGVCPSITMNYYSTVSGLYGIDLKNQLHEVIDDGVANIGTYSNTTAKLMQVDEDPDNSNNVIEHYARVSMPKANYSGYQQSAYDWDKEHVWAKSHGAFTDLKAGADIMNLRPAFGSTNSARGNMDYDNLGSNPTTKTVTLNSQVITTGYINTNGSFTPTDQAKGDIARILMYMVVMYNGDTASQGLDLEFNDLVTNTTAPYHGRISVLMQWHLQDPVDASEIRRNNLVYGIQGNRNPFVDYPHFAELIWPSYYA